MSKNSRANTAPALLNKSRIVEQFSDGPTLQGVASQLLRAALNKRFPLLELDPDKALLVSPVWRQQGEDLITHSSRVESLTQALMRQAFTLTTANYIEGEHFLTVTPHAVEPIHLPVSMDAITTLLNEQASQLFTGFEQSQLDYWNESVDQLPRWQILADTLKKSLDVQSVIGWDADQCSLGRLVSQHPDKASRPIAVSSLSNVRARMLDLDLTFEMAEGTSTRHLMLPGALVLTATSGSRELILMYTITDGYESFNSMAQLGAVLPERIDIDLSGHSLRWRLYEPEGNIFDAMTWALVGCQLDAIDALDPSSRSPWARTATRQDTGTISARDNARIEQLQDAIPDWLSEGSLEDLQAYSGYVTRLGALRGEADSDDFNIEDIPLIQIYAQQQMCAAIIAAKTGEEALSLRLNDIRITVTHSFEAGGFTLPDSRTRSVETLGEFALQNIRPYSAQVAYADGAAAPDWMTVSFLTRMANQVNVGETYPQLIKRTLIDIPDQARRYRARYCRQLPLLLPLLALEYKLKRQGGVDEQGFHQVCQLMNSIENNAPAADRSVQIRPLAFMPHYRLGSTPDTVANMYIIGPRDGFSGPCLLYRPLLEEPLRQFPSEQNMLYAFYQPGELRDSILAWLPDRALSFEYAQYVFSSGVPSPRVITELAFEPFIHLDLSASVELANTPMSGDIFATLFAQNSQAMVDLGDRQSTSNAERRWALLADSGWTIFSVAANFLSGPAGTAVWVWQTIDQIQQAIDAHERGDSIVEWSSIGDVLLTLGILLIQTVAARRIRLSRAQHANAASKRLPVDDSLITVPSSKTAPTVMHDATPLSAELPKTHLSTLAPATLGRVNAGAQFLQQLNRFKVLAPHLPEGAQPNAEHLYELAGKRYAQVGERWFQISAEADEPVFIIDPNDPERSGFGVKYDADAGRWHWDLKLRLRGGGPTGRIQALRREKLKKKDEAWAALNLFIAQESTRKLSLDEALKSIESNEVSAPLSEETIATYISTSNELANGYGQALEDLEKWREAGGGGVFYQSQLMRFTVEQHRCLNGWMRMKMLEYAKTVAPLLSQSEAPTTLPRAEQMQAAQKAIEVSDEMIDRLGRLNSSLDRLMSHTGITRKVAGELKNLLPAFSRYDLEANEIGMSTELCLREVQDSDPGEVRQLVEKIFDSAANAGHALVERRTNTDVQPLTIDQLTAMVDRLANSEQRLGELAVSSADDIEPVRFSRVRHLVAAFHQLARNRLLKLLPEPEEIPAAAVARPEPLPSTSRTIGKVSKSRPRVTEPQKTLSTEKPETGEEIPIVRAANRRRALPSVLSDEEIVANGMKLNAECDAFIRRTRADAQRPSRIPADMKDLFELQATRMEQAATEVDAGVERNKAQKLPIATLGDKLRSGAGQIRREGNIVYGTMLMGRKPRETYLQWLHDHGQVEIVKDPRGPRQRKDYFQEYKINDKTPQNKALWVAHFHYDQLTDPDDHFTAAHLKFADGYLQELPDNTRQELNTFDAMDNALRRIVSPTVVDLFLKPGPQTPSSQ